MVSFPNNSEKIVHGLVIRLAGGYVSYCLFAILLAIGSMAYAASPPPCPISKKAMQAAFAGRQGCLVIINCSSAATYRYNPTLASEKLPPCSTFKIWNTLIGLETGVITSADAPFYTWDGVTRSIPEWNHDLTVRQAFQASCVPAFQAMARKIGAERMKSWIEKLGYGDRDISAGIDRFWLPEKGRKTLLITPDAQATMICKLVMGKLPVSQQSRAVLKDIMTVRKTARGTLYGKTGTGADDTGAHNICWFVGYVETGGEPYAFACMFTGSTHQTGKDARALVQALLETSKML